MSTHASSTPINRRSLLVAASSAALVTRFAYAAAVSAEQAAAIDPEHATVEWASDRVASVLARPRSLAVSPAGRLHVVDADRRSVLVFDKGTYVREWSDPAISGEIAGIAINARSIIFLADTDARAVRAYDPAGRPIGVIEECSDGTRFSSVTALMATTDGSLLVADADAGRILQLHLPDLTATPDDAYLPDEPHPVP